MEKSFTIVGRSIDEAWREYRPLLKIWLTTYLIFFAVNILVMIPYYRTMFINAMMDVYTPMSGGYFFIITLLSVASIFIASGLMVNSWKYLINRSFEPSWVPFRFDWSTSFAVFGYYLLITLLFILILFAFAIVFGFSMAGIFQGFYQLDYFAEISMGSRFGMALGTIASFLAFAGFIYLCVWLFRASMILTVRSVETNTSLGNVLAQTKSAKSTFFWVSVTWFIALIALLILMYFLMLAAFALPVALLFFIPSIGAVIGGVFSVIVYFMLIFAVMFISVTITAELYRTYFAKADASPK